MIESEKEYLKKGISIVICCYNSAARLPETLKHIALQKVSREIPWEVIVVNNASQDNTKEVAEFLWKSLNSSVAFRIVYEPVPGLSAARDRGLAVAQYKYLLFCDDDNWLQDDYVQIAYGIMESDSEIAALGGQFEAVFEEDPPAWFSYFASNYTVGKQAPACGEITYSRSYVSGAGAVYRKSALVELKEKGFRSLLTDRKGNSLSTGGDVEIGYAIRMAGYKIWYDDRLRVKHFIPKERLTRNYVERLYKGYLESAPVHIAYKQNFYPRKKFKKSWQWLLLMRILFVLRKKFISLLVNSGKEYWIRRLEFLFELNVIKSILNNRHNYIHNLRKVEQGAWNKLRNTA